MEVPIVGTLKFALIIRSFSKLQNQKLYSDVSSLGPYKWRIVAYPKGNNVANHLSIYLEVADSETLPSGWSRSAKFSLILINQYNNSLSRTIEFAQREFNEKGNGWGVPLFISHQELYDLTKGYLLGDACIIEANVVIYNDARSKGEPTKQDMEAFFGDLNSLIFPKKATSSEEEAKEALRTIEETVNMVPTDVSTPGRMSQLRDAFDVLSSLEDSSVLTPQQKATLLALKDNFIALPERAATAAENKKLITEKGLVKKTLDKKLVRCLVEFEKAKTETLQNEREISVLLRQVVVKKRKWETSSSKQKEMFKISKEMKAELDMLVKNWPEYEAKTKAAEEEEKVIGIEWTKMKQLIWSLNKPFNSSLKPNHTLGNSTLKRRRKSNESN